ncbi:MAG: L,D-transpeptidase [Alphaproteobacteria bacterium]|nr:MAG: L,D-transpeptidase [Alphaproteobacteria bacterium]
MLLTSVATASAQNIFEALFGRLAAPPGPVPDANFTARDRQQLANPPYRQAWIPPAYRRQIVRYHRKEAPGTVLVDTDARYVYYVLAEGKAIRYGAIVGEDAQAWSGVATVGRKEEWPGWTPTEGEKRRLGPLPNYVEGGASNPMGARALYLYVSGQDTLYRIHGTNQPGWIGHAISDIHGSLNPICARADIRPIVHALNRDAFISNHKLASLPGPDPAIHPASKHFFRSRWMRG